jgi:crotonobetainyl-CoA:carnitine CoA-transferase CaiB-like acyl-CoA transferase
MLLRCQDTPEVPNVSSNAHPMPTAHSSPSRPLAGVRVLDLSNVLAGPFSAYQLGLMGATVLKIESPETGDLARRLGADVAASNELMGASFVAVNGGKESMTLNLKTPEGKEILKALVREFDVLVENFRPGVMARLGLDYDTLAKENPQLIYCAVSGFGQDGEWKERPAYDQIIQGLSGLMSVTGDEASAPLRVGFPVCDTIGGMAAAFAIVSALHGRHASGRGTFIDIAMLDATLASMGWVVSNFLSTGIVPQPMGNQNVAAAPSGSFRTATNLLNIAANEQKQYEALCDAIDRADLKTDPQFAERATRKMNRVALDVEIEKALSHKSADEWETIFNARSIPCGKVMSVPEILAESQVRDRGLVHRFASAPDTSPHARVAVGSAAILNGERLAPQSAPPMLGEDTDRWLRALGHDEATIADFRARGVV